MVNFRKQDDLACGLLHTFEGLPEIYCIFLTLMTLPLNLYITMIEYQYKKGRPQPSFSKSDGRKNVSWPHKYK